MWMELLFVSNSTIKGVRSSKTGLKTELDMT